MTDEQSTGEDELSVGAVAAPAGPPVSEPPEAPDLPEPAAGLPDRRGSWWPSWGLVATKFLELRKRRGLMVAVVLLTMGFPVLVLGLRLLFHAIDPKTYGPAGSPSVFQVLSLTMALFGFIIAATLGATAGTSDLSDGVFRHLVITGRSRLALYLARIPAGLTILLPLVAAAFALVCVVTAYAGTAQPTALNENGVSVPYHLDQSQLERWLLDHPDRAEQAFVGGVKVFRGGPLGGQGVVVSPGGSAPSTATIDQMIQHRMSTIYLGYTLDELTQLNPASNEMVKIGLWIELEVAVGFMVGLGLGSLTGQRTVSVIMLVALQLIVTPILAMHAIPYFLNGQRLVVGVAMDQLRPAYLLGQAGGGGPLSARGLGIPPMPTWAMVTVIVGWIVGWTVVGAWRMVTRDT